MVFLIINPLEHLISTYAIYIISYHNYANFYNSNLKYKRLY
jgi:hypothetical protein